MEEKRNVSKILAFYNWKDAFSELKANEAEYNSETLKAFYPKRTGPKKECRFMFVKKNECFSPFQIANIALMNCKAGDYIPYISNGIKYLFFYNFSEKSIRFKNDSGKILVYNFESEKYNNLLMSLIPFITCIQLGYKKNTGTLQEMIERDESISVTNENIYRIESVQEFQLRTILQNLLKIPVLIKKHLDVKTATKSLFSSIHPKSVMTTNTCHWYGKKYWLQPSPVVRYKPKNSWLKNQLYKEIILPEKLDIGFQVWKESKI